MSSQVCSIKVTVQFYIQTSAGCLQSLGVKILIPPCNTVTSVASAQHCPCSDACGNHKS